MQWQLRRRRLLRLQRLQLSCKVNRSASQRDYWATGLLVYNTINLLVYEPTSVHFCTRWLVAFSFRCLFEIFIIKSINASWLKKYHRKKFVYWFLLLSLPHLLCFSLFFYSLHKDKKKTNTHGGIIVKKIRIKCCIILLS